METMKVSEVMSLFPETKGQIEDFAQKMVSSILENEQDVFKIETQLACMENVCKSIRKNDLYKEKLLNESEKQGAKTFKMFNAEFQIKETGVKYHFEDCGHPEYISICEQIQNLDERKKELEKELKAHSKNWIYTEINSGDQYEIFPPTKTSTTQVVTTINK